jgi:hypothetical protein
MIAIQEDINVVKKETSNICYQIKEEDRINEFLDFALVVTKDFEKLNKNLFLLNEKVYSNLNDSNITSYIHEFETLFHSLAKLVAIVKNNTELRCAIKTVFSEYQDCVREFKENLDDIKLAHIEIPKDKEFQLLMKKVAFTLT